jgi:hypothetical protein
LTASVDGPTAASDSAAHSAAAAAASVAVAAWGDDCTSALEDTHVDLRRTPFDVYRALRLPKREGGGYSGGTARARASYHREAVRCHPDNLPPGCGACYSCGGALRLGQGLTLVPVSAQLELTLPLSAQPKLTLSLM